jgi:DNA-binding response OmpR family regulator
MAPPAAPPVSVVVVDDDEASLRIIETYLLQDGCAVRCFTDPAAALESMNRTPPDVLVSDWLMKGMDGPDLMKAVRASTSLQGTYCILVTAHDSRGKKVAGLLVGADDYLAKPISEMELLARIRVGLRVRRLERQAMMAAMAATLGHEVNNPLTGVLGFLDVARAHLKAGRTAEALEAVGRIEEAAERIRRVVAALLENQDPRLKGVLPGASVIEGKSGSGGPPS